MKSVFTDFFFRNGHDPSVQVNTKELEFQKTKVSIHEQLIDSLNLSIVSEISHAEFAVEIRALASQICIERANEIAAVDRDRMIGYVGCGVVERVMDFVHT